MEILRKGIEKIIETRKQISDAIKRYEDRIDAEQAIFREEDFEKIKLFPAHKPGCSMTMELRTYQLYKREVFMTPGWGGGGGSVGSTSIPTDEILIRCVGCDGSIKEKRPKVEDR